MTHTGQVQAVSVSPGNLYALTVTFTSPQAPSAPVHALFSIEPDAELYVNGKRTGADDFFAWLIRAGKVLVTIHPDPVRYGLSTKTEFATQRE